MAKPEAKILRIGILQGGKIIEERLLRRREVVSIGQSPKNTFYVPISKLPRTLTLFEVKSGQYQMALGPSLAGRVSVDDQVCDIATLGQHPKAVKGGSGALFPLDEKCRGKIVLGDITVLFQFVQPPPVVPKPQLPASARGGIGHALMQESAFLLAILASLVVQGGFIALSMAFETPPDKVKKKNRFIQALKVDVEIDDEDEEEIEEPVKNEKEEPKETADEEVEAPQIVEPEPPPMPEPPKKQPKVAKKPEAPAKKPAEKSVAKSPSEKEAIKKRRQMKVRNNTILKHITAAGPNGTAGPDALRGGHAERYKDAFQPTAITVGKPGDKGGFRGGPKLEGDDANGGSRRVAKLEKGERGDGKLKTGKVARASKAAKKERKVRLRVGLKGGRKSGGLGKLDGSTVTSVFRRRASAFRACYESRLKVNPNIKGKVVIRFTIGTAGRITNISVASNSTGDSAVGRCIVQRVRGWRFKRPENGAVTFTYPIVLSKG